MFGEPGTACARRSPYTSCDQSLTYVAMSVQNAESASQPCIVFWYTERSLVRWPKPITRTAPRVGRAPSPPS